MKRRVMALVLVVAMIMGITACSKTKDTSSNGGSDSGSTPTTSTGSTDTSNADSGSDASKIDTSEHVVITYMTTGNKPTNGQNEIMLEKLNKILTEKCNAEIEIYWIEWTDYMTNYNLTLASQDGTVDLVGTATDWLDAWPNTKKGAFLELTEDMLSTYAPQTYSQVSKEHWDMCKYDDKIYLIPEDNYAQWINHGFMYRSDWATQFGLTNGVHSWEDLGTYFAGIKANYPDVIPWDAAGNGTSVYNALSGGWMSSKTDNIFIDGLDVPIFYGNSKDDLYTIVSPFMEGNEFIDFATTMKQWADAGYWREDVLNYAGETREEFYVGQTGADQHHTQTWYTTVRPRMDKDNPGSNVELFYFGEESKNLTKMSITHGAMAVASGSDNPERALMVYDLLRNDEECYRLFSYGVEGTQYVVTSDGKLDRPEGYDQDADSIATNFWWGRNDALELPNATHYTDGFKQMSDEYNQFAIDYPYGQLVFETEDVASYLSNMSDVYATYMPRIAFGKADDPAALVAEFRQAMLDAGYQQVLDNFQAQMTAFKDTIQ